MKGMNIRLVLAGFALTLGACTTPVTAPVTDRPISQESAPVAGQAESGVVGGPARQEFHVVEKGDTLNRIAQRFGYTWQEVAAWNNMTDPNQLAVGQRIRVAPPGGGAVTVTPITPSGPSIGSTPTSSPEAGPPAAPSAQAPSVKRTPVGGVQVYSDEAWKAANEARPATPPQPSAPEAPESATSSPDLSAPWIWPTNGKVLSNFADGKTKGIDIAGKPGDDVLASSAGRVVYAGAGLRGYGKLVIIKHNADFLSAYAHNQTLLVKEGQSVTKGQKIAELGDTDADRPKLHFEIRRRGKPVDPLKYLPNR